MCLSSAPVYNFELLHFQLKTICLKGSGSFFQHFWQCIRWELFFCNIYAGVPYHRVAEAHLRLAAQPHIGPKWTISRSEQYPEGPYMYSPWSELCPKFVQGMWARWTLSEQIWWSNRDPWALQLNASMLQKRTYLHIAIAYLFRGALYLEYNTNAWKRSIICHMHHILNIKRKTICGKIAVESYRHF